MAEQVLEAAALAAGLSGTEAVRTVESGMGAGRQDPRQAPEKPRPRAEKCVLSAHRVAGGIGAETPVLETIELLEDIQAFIRRYVVLTDAQAVAVALWVAHTHTLDAADCTPYLDISSATKQCGKTRLLEVLDLLVNDPWFTGRATAAVLVRKIDGERPTLLLDESDPAFKGEKEYAETLRGVLNTGYKRNGRSSMCVGQGAAISYKDFSTFCPKAIAGLGKLPDTVADRSIPVKLQRRSRLERVERFRERIARGEAEPIRQALSAFSRSVTGELRDARPAIPDELDDRAGDVWEPLLALADHAGGDWPGRALSAALKLSARGGRDDDSSGERLLSDIRDVFGQLSEEDKIFSADLVGRLKRPRVAMGGVDCREADQPTRRRENPRPLRRQLTHDPDRGDHGEGLPPRAV